MKSAFFVFLQLLLSNLTTDNSDTLKLLFLGDIMQHQTQLDVAKAPGSKTNAPSAYDYSSYFKYLSGRFGKVDLRIANMETTFTTLPYSGYPRFTSPASLLEDSHKGGIDIFLTANNHINDKGLRGLKETISLYDSLGLKYTGIYKNPQDELENNPLIIDKKGFKIAILNYTYGTNGNSTPAPYVVKLIDTTIIKADLARASKLSPDFTIVCLHWGMEYKLKHTVAQERLSEIIHSYGADVIIGSHPHVPQGYDIKYDENNDIRNITVYSLGNVISNMTAPNTRIGMMAEIDLYKDSLGSKKILPPKFEYIWTSRPNMFDKNFTTLPIEEYLEKPELFKDIYEYQKMKRYYLEITK